ncbi:MAG: DUF488 domain-containing protein [Marinobacter sp.]|uniref:DUF488 domain-containing protein n=1 Tax=Marinobacter sp. TaxID=50741 RepID=UPI00299DC52A|nr:DUF488 domain-containing protein [Marinobacter sp.]MDX1634178.1 DUF488 domain-containing protein [Marinobacter sp.]
MTDIRLKRVYDDPARSDGLRVLVDRVWPRGLSKEKAGLDHWFKDLAPSTELRKWYGHDPDRWPEFRDRYRQELKDEDPEDLARLKECLEARDRVTLLFSAKETDRNNAVALAEFLNNNEV